MPNKEINSRLIKQGRFFRNMGYTFNTLVDHYLMEQRYQTELEIRLLYIDKMHGQTCLCSAMVNDQKVEGNTVPLLYCVIKEGKDGHKCPYVKVKSEVMERAIELHKELIKEKSE